MTETHASARRIFENALVEGPERGEYRVRRSVFTDEEIFELEMKHIFEGNWVYLAHETQIPEVGDYFTTYIGRQPVVITRNKQGELGALIRGRIAGAEGDIDAARAHFERALSRLEPLPLPYDRARVNFAYGQTLRRAGKRREADVALKNAREDYRSLGARTYVERCDRELQAGGLHTGRAGAGPSHLTAQERAVARLVARGMSNQDTAQELFVSVKTVQYHLTHIYSKLGIRSRGELAAQFAAAFE